MDQITVDATEIDGVQPGDPVVLIGAQGDLDQSAEELGTQAGTISYDILTGILPRVPRLYVERGAVVATSVASSQSETLAGNTSATDSVE